MEEKMRCLKRKLKLAREESLNKNRIREVELKEKKKQDRKQKRDEIKGRREEEKQAKENAIEIKEDQAKTVIINVKKAKPQKKQSKKPNTKKDPPSRSYLIKRKKANESNRKYLAKMTPDQLEVKRAKDRERYKKGKELKQIKGIKELGKKEQKNKRKAWRTNSQNYRQRKAQLASVITITPSDSEASPNISERASRGRKKVKLNRSSVYRKLKNTEEELTRLRRVMEKYKKRCSRLSAKLKTSTPSPKSKVTKFLCGRSIPRDVRKRLLYGESLNAQIKQKSIESRKTQKDRQLFMKCVSGKILKKYRLIGQANQLYSYKDNKKFCNSNNFNYDRKKRIHVLTYHVKNEIKEFLEDDQVSRMCPGKKDVISNGKQKSQRRVLLDSLKNLHKKFVESKGIDISYVTFWRAKPFWIVEPKNKDRNTCACIKHENMGFIIVKLHALKIVDEKRADDLFGKKMILNTETHDLNETVKYFKWENVLEERTVRGEIKKIRITVKNQVSCTKSELLEKLKVDLPIYQKHVENMLHQAKALKNKKINLKENEILCQIDFSENYVTKCSTEIQSMHFGASKKQIALHTGVLYFRNENELKSQSFCSVSDNIDHQAHAIWAHLTPVLDNLVNEIPQVDTIHFFSDGPTAQYRNRNNMYLFITQLPKLIPNLKLASWNFSEAGHGKGPMDGVGGYLKRSADLLVMKGDDIMSSAQFVENLKECRTNLFLIEPKEVERMKNNFPVDIPAVPGIMSVHQSTWSKASPRTIFIRGLSCFKCPFNAPCQHHCLTKESVELITEQVPEQAPSHLEKPYQMDVKAGSFVVVQFSSKKTTKHFIGMVQSSSHLEGEGDFIIKFLKRKSDLGFIFPATEDNSVINREEIKAVLNDPVIDRREVYIFNNDLSTFENLF